MVVFSRRKIHGIDDRNPLPQPTGVVEIKNMHLPGYTTGVAVKCCKSEYGQFTVRSIMKREACVRYCGKAQIHSFETT
jgi:hypothetical protein